MEIKLYDLTKIDDNALALLKGEMSKFDDEGISYSFIATKIDGTKLFSYNEDWIFTSQSTIKAPFVCSLLDSRPELFLENYQAIKEIITISSNEYYEALREKYGTEYLKKWMDKAGLDEKLLKWVYPRNIRVSDLAAFWPLMYDFLTTKAPKELVDWFYGTMYSAIYNKLGSKYKTWTKAGWENGIGDGNDITDQQPDPCYTDGNPENDEVATNDSGIICTKNGPYIMVIFTNVPTNPPKLENLVGAINNLAEKLL